MHGRLVRVPGRYPDDIALIEALPGWTLDSIGELPGDFVAELMTRREARDHYERERQQREQRRIQQRGRRQPGV